MIVICTNPFLSHLLPTLPLANELTLRGHEVIYMGFTCMRELVEKEGFEFISLTSCTDEEIQNSKRLHQYNQMQEYFKVVHLEVTEKVKDLNPSIVLFHISRFDIFYFPLYALGLRLMTYDTCLGSIEFNSSVPPSTSTFIPRYQWDVRNLYYWIKRYLRKKRDLKWDVIKDLYPYNRYKEVSKKENYKMCFCIDGYYLKIPHIKFCPRELEFKEDKNIRYAGLCVLPQENKGENEHIKSISHPFIYCSLGTMNHRYLKTNYFFEALIEVMKRHEDISMLITLGARGKKLEIKEIPKNVIICDFVDQQSILDEADLVITHGGAGTIKECIFHEVPMLVSPSVYDQMGNAARVYFHKIGLRNNYMRKNLLEQKLKKNIRKININHLDKQILLILSCQEYKNNISNLNNTIASHNDFEDLVCHLSGLD